MAKRATQELGGTASVMGTRVVVRVAQARKVDLAAPDGRIPIRLQRRLWELASERAHDPSFGLHVAEASRLGTFEALDFALWASATFADALERIGRFYRLLGDDLELHVVVRDAIARVHRVVAHEQRHRAECLFAVLTLRARELLGQTFRLREVRFTHRALFQCPVRSPDRGGPRVQRSSTDGKPQAAKSSGKTNVVSSATRPSASSERTVRQTAW